MQRNYCWQSLINEKMTRNGKTERKRRGGREKGTKKKAKRRIIETIKPRKHIICANEWV